MTADAVTKAGRIGGYPSGGYARTSARAMVNAEPTVRAAPSAGESHGGLHAPAVSRSFLGASVADWCDVTFCHDLAYLIMK
jgi:hypothetical protein